MAWKTERWLEEVFPGKDQIFSAYRGFSGRELVIVASAVLDTALASLLARRLRNLPSEAEAFLGVAGDGRAPVASFGARIQLALLIGLLTERDAAILRHLKNLRNLLSHRVKADLCSEAALKPLRALLAEWRSLSEDLLGSKVRVGPGLDALADQLGKTPAAAEGLVLAILATYQALFHRLSDRVEALDLVR